MTSGVSAPPTPPVPSPVVVDTSVWISWLIATDSNNAAATAWLVGHTNRGGEMLAPSFLLAEIAGAVRRITGSESDALALVTTLENFAPLTIIPVNNRIILEAVKVAARFALRGSDALYVALAGLLGVTLVSFDNEQLTRPTGYIATSQP